jgi:hypothetical protein
MYKYAPDFVLPYIKVSTLKVVLDFGKYGVGGLLVCDTV